MPKAKEEEVPEPPPSASFEDEWEAEEVVCGLLDDLIAGAEAEVRAKELKAAVVPLTVSSLAATIRSAVECYFISHDAGEPELKTASNWSVGAEPVPALIDTWSRGAVPVKKPAPAPPATAESGTLSARTSEAPRTPRAKTPGSERGERVPDALPQPDPKAPVVVAKPEPGKVVSKPKKGAPIVTAMERQKKRLDAEAREEVVRLDRLKADLKGRDYTYDTHGTVIVMEDMVADRLPPFQQQPRLALSGGGRGGGAPPQAASGGGRGKSGRGGARGSGRGAGPRIDFGNSSTFRQLDSLQPPLLETMGVGPGVRLVQGEGSKGGEPRVFDGERMSKAVFEQVANSSGGFTSRRPVGGSDPAMGSSNPLGSSSPVDVPPPTPIVPTSTGNGGRIGGESVEPAARPPFMPSSPGPGDNQGLPNKIQRDRGGMPIKNRLPPPALGATTGHGQGVPYCAPASPEGSQVTGSAAGGLPPQPAAMKLNNPGALREILR